MKVIPIRPGVRIMAKSFNFEWRDAILSEGCRVKPTTKLVLLSLTKYMGNDGSDCYPSTRAIALDTGLSRRCVETHLHKAEASGWLAIEHRRPSGQGWRRYRYVPRRGERGSPDQGVPAKKVGKSVHDVGNLMHEGGEPHSPDQTIDQTIRPIRASYEDSAEREARSALCFEDFSTKKQVCKIEEDFRRQPEDRRYVKTADDMLKRLGEIMDEHGDDELINGHAERVMTDIEFMAGKVA